jgi:hypothetical protein
MNKTMLPGSSRRIQKLPLLVALLVALVSIPFAYSSQQPQQAANGQSTIPAAEFARLIQELSEPGGYFHSDNFASNETGYLHIVDKLKELGVAGGAYVGVGPEQNFTYIAKIHPRIAFIVDIRRQAIIQHLMYKAIFHHAKDRAQFLSLLFSKPLPANRSAKDFTLEELLQYIAEAPSSQEIFRGNLAVLRKTIEDDFHFPLSPEEAKSLDYVYSSFWRANLRIGFSFGNSYGSYGSFGFPGLKELILATDFNGNLGNFLAIDQDYQFVRTLQEQNRVIPVVGDFAGKKALASVGEYLRKNGYTLSAFYTSNVEQFLFENDVFSAYAENVRKLPVNDKSVFIRAARIGWTNHPAAVAGERMTPLLQKIAVFDEDYQQGRIADYWSLVSKHYIAAIEPRKPAPAATAP